MEPIARLEAQLNDYSPAQRAQALTALMAVVKPPAAKQQPVVNLHCHTFFSFNAFGYSPSGLAWLAQQRGFRALGIVDFDVLDGIDEFLGACDRLGVRGSAGMETRAFLPEFATREINSPGEPGVIYHMGLGFVSGWVPPAAVSILMDMRQRSEERNRRMVDRINAFLDPLMVEYDRDVVPLTPAGNVTERHILVAYMKAAGERLTNPIPFWAGKLNFSNEYVSTQIGDAVKFQNTLRTKLMKRGGVGYAQPGPDTFPRVDEVHRLIVACGALPCAAWLDGTSTGEQNEAELLDLLVGKGVAALNIVPDRNWNIADPEIRRVKVEKLYEVVNLARQFDLPINVGTEMNAPGQKLVDDLEVRELAPARQAFLDGADFIYGHTILQRALGLGYQSEWARAYFPARHDRNAFYISVGRILPPGQAGLNLLTALSPSLTPPEMMNKLKAQV